MANAPDEDLTVSPGCVNNIQHLLALKKGQSVSISNVISVFCKLHISLG